MSDIVAELRRTVDYERLARLLECHIQMHEEDVDGCGGDCLTCADFRAAIRLLGHLPALLDLVEALRRYIGHLDQGRRHIDNDTALDAWDRKVGQNWDLIEDALAALELDGA